MGKFDGVLICTDLDGTLFKDDKTISEENVRAIEYFKKEGGLFTFVTGRMPFYVADVVDRIHPNAPYGCINGGGLYDAKAQKYLWTVALADGVSELISYIEKCFPAIGIHVNTFDKIYFCKENQTMKNFRKITKLENRVRSYREIHEPLSKVVFGSEEDAEILAIQDALHAHPLAKNYSFIRSERVYYEILPKGISKGTSIEKLCEVLHIDKNKTIAIGDYNNDVPMFHAAKVGIAVSNACEEALKTADFMTVSNEEHAIAQVILDLEKGVFGI